MAATEETITDFSCTICDIFWERIFLHFTIKVDLETEIAFRLVNQKTDEKISVTPEKKEDGKYFFCLNITAANGRSFLENGSWTVEYDFGTSNQSRLCLISSELAYQLDDLTRVFRYGSDEFAYTVDFSVFSVDQEKLNLAIKSYFMKKNSSWRKRQIVYRPQRCFLIRLFDKIVSAVWVDGINCIYRFLNIFHKKSNKKNLLIMNETGELNAGNLKAIDDRLKERGLDKEIHISYSYRKVLGENINILSWLRLVMKLAFQDIILLDNYAPIFSFLKLRKDVQLIQVWHAGAGFKAVGYCRFGKAGSPFPDGSCHKAYTTVLTGSDKLIKVFEEVFGIEKDAFIPAGIPRLDEYLNPEKIEKFKTWFYDKYSYLKDKKIILFAPTYRGDGQKDAYYDYKKIDLKRIYDFCDNEYVFLIKMHPFIKNHINIPKEFQNRIYDFSDFFSINNLYYVAEILITDYSSDFYEFSLMKKPILFYTYDRQVYELTHGVYRSVKESAPGKVCDTFEELLSSLKNKDYDYDKTEAYVRDNFTKQEKSATDILIDDIILKQ